MRQAADAQQMAHDARVARRRLSALQRTYALPTGYTLADTLLQRVAIGSLELCMVGLVGVGPDGTQVVGAAADARGFPVERAFFELIERASVLLARAAKKPIALRDADGALLRRVGVARVFPRDPQPERVRASLSNGVALHTSWSAACAAARCELVERDRVLRSFRGEFAPVPQALPDARLSRALRKLYDVEAYAFGPRGRRLEHHVAGLFLFPRQADHPLAYGFAAASDAELAQVRATREALQRLAFLWGEPIPSKPPEPAPTPDFHQEYYLYPGQHAQLRRWLSGRAVVRRRRALRPFDGEGVWFADLTPPTTLGALYVVRAGSARARSLTFGRARRTPIHPVV